MYHSLISRHISPIFVRPTEIPSGGSKTSGKSFVFPLGALPSLQSRVGCPGLHLAPVLHPPGNAPHISSYQMLPFLGPVTFFAVVYFFVIGGAYFLEVSSEGTEGKFLQICA